MNEKRDYWQDLGRFQRALRAFDSVHRQDGSRLLCEGRETTKALRYHERLTYWVRRTVARPSEALLLAARCQHLRRGAIPRQDYPEGRTGYRRWRTALAKLHAQEAGQILAGCGYSEDMIQRVGELIRKKGLKHDPEVQLFEDAICLLFLETEVSAFAAKHDREKVLSVLAKTWKKMSDSGRQQGLAVMADQPKEIRLLMERAVNGESTERETRSTTAF